MMRELVQQNIYAFLTPITVLISGLVVSLLFTRLLPAQFGVFTTLISFTMLFAGISDLGVPNTLVKIAGGSFHSKDGHAGFYVRYLLKWKLAAMIIVSAALLVFSKELAQVFLHDAGFAYVMQAMSVLVILFSISQFVTTLFTSIGRFEYLSVISVILNGSKVLFPILFILLFGSSLSSIIEGCWWHSLLPPSHRCCSSYSGSRRI